MPTTTRPSVRPPSAAAAGAVAVAVVAASRTATTGETPTPTADDDESDSDDESDDPTTTAATTTAQAATAPPAVAAAAAAASPAPATTTTAASPDDPPNTVVHERAPRSDKGKADNGDGNDEIQGISGSTRLEAKRQRRRDGRDAGRRRPPILSEAEFLARREAVERMMVVRDKVRTEPPHEGARYTQIAVLEDGVVVEHFVTSAASASLVGNIYLGIVQNVLPSMEAAFVDIGRGRNGVLYAGEVELGGRRPRRRPAQDRTGPQARRLRRRPGQQGPGRAQGRPADHAGVAGRPLPGVRAGRVVDRASAASCPTPNASGSRRSCARWCPRTPA